MQIGLFFGSFNPIHVGHLIIAQYIINTQTIEEIWFVISPQSPFKKKADLSSNEHRLEMVKLATAKNSALKASSIEFNLPTPSYTINTLEVLKEKHPDFNFSLIMGSDNLQHFHKWKRYEEILENYKLLVYERPNYFSDAFNAVESVLQLDGPLLNISATYIRSLLKDSKSALYLLQDAVNLYIVENNLYK